jgi:hypothetical protein
MLATHDELHGQSVAKLTNLLILRPETWTLQAEAQRILSGYGKIAQTRSFVLLAILK